MVPKMYTPKRYYCSRPKCHNLREPRQIMCKVCWKLVPKDLQDLVWAEFKKKPASIEHLEAIRLAGKAVLDQLAITPKGASDA